MPAIFEVEVISCDDLLRNVLIERKSKQYKNLNSPIINVS